MKLDLIHLAVVAGVQGITEFLPVSSSGHLVLVPLFMQVSDQGLIIDVAVHVGTLGAALLYFWRDVFAMVGGLVQMMKGRRDPGANLAGLLVLGTIPVLAAGYVLNHYFPQGIRGLEVIGWTTLGFGLLLLIADQTGMTLRRIEHLRIGDVIIVGLVQTLALIPGTSRSGICMTAGRFAMLLGIPAIAGAGVLKGWELYKLGDAQLSADTLLSGGLAFVTALIAIALMMSWLRRASFTVFGVYRLLLGGFLLAIAYGWIG